MSMARCKNCGKEFEVKGNRKVFCSKECSDWHFGYSIRRKLTFPGKKYKTFKEFMEEKVNER